MRKWFKDKWDRFLTFCRENPQAVEAIGTVGELLSSGMILAAAIVGISGKVGGDNDEEID